MLRVAYQILYARLVTICRTIKLIQLSAYIPRCVAPHRKIKTINTDKLTNDYLNFQQSLQLRFDFSFRMRPRSVSTVWINYLIKDHLLITRIVWSASAGGAKMIIGLRVRSQNTVTFHQLGTGTELSYGNVSIVSEWSSSDRRMLSAAFAAKRSRERVVSRQEIAPRAESSELQVEWHEFRGPLMGSSSSPVIMRCSASGCGNLLGLKFLRLGDRVSPRSRLTI